MSITQNLKATGKKSWSIIRGLQVIGVCLGALFTIAAYMFCVMNPPENVFDLSYNLMLLVILPASLIAKTIGISPNIFINANSGTLAFLPSVLVLLINACLFFLVASIAGFLVTFLKSKASTNI